MCIVYSNVSLYCSVSVYWPPFRGPAATPQNRSFHDPICLLFIQMLMFILGYSGTVTKNNQIATIANFGPEYRVKVKVIVHSARSEWSNILRFTSTDSNCCNIGDRVPAIFLRPGGGAIAITNAVGANGNYHFDHNIEIGKLYDIEIVQEKENGKVREYT